MTTSNTIVVGSRGSRLALTQTQEVIDKLQALYLDYRFEVRKIVTQGDRLRDTALARIGGKGIFVKELESALLAGEIDIAVHSFKDLPSEMGPGLEIAAAGERLDSRDCLVSRDGIKLAQLPPGARLGTSSPRRAAQIKSRCPDLEVLNIRGNVDTRWRKVADGQYEATVMAAAGLLRLGWSEHISEYLSTEVCLPAVGQGALAVQVRQDDHRMKQVVSAIDHLTTRQAVAAERALLRRLGGGCQTPIAALGRMEGVTLLLEGMVASPDGKQVIKDRAQGPAFEPEAIGYALAERLLSLGADKLLEEEPL